MHEFHMTTREVKTAGPLMCLTLAKVATHQSYQLLDEVQRDPWRGGLEFWGPLDVVATQDVRSFDVCGERPSIAVATRAPENYCMSHSTSVPPLQKIKHHNFMRSKCHYDSASPDSPHEAKAIFRPRFLWDSTKKASLKVFKERKTKDPRDQTHWATPTSAWHLPLLSSLLNGVLALRPILCGLLSLKVGWVWASVDRSHMPSPCTA